MNKDMKQQEDVIAKINNLIKVLKSLRGELHKAVAQDELERIDGILDDIENALERM